MEKILIWRLVKSQPRSELEKAKKKAARGEAGKISHQRASTASFHTNLP
jgi:hypothetical protein